MKPAVIVVHGLYLHAFCMQFWRMHLRAAGYEVFGFNYPSMSQPLTDSARQLSDFIATLDNETIYCVGHSLGGLLIMQMLHEFPQARVRRVVLVGSPYQKAHVPQALARHALGRFILGKAIRQWMAQPPLTLSSAEVGVVAGNRPYGLGRLVAPGIPVPHDGTVAVAETDVPGMTDKMVFPVTHTQMLFSAMVMKHMENFLRHGKFDHVV